MQCRINRIPRVASQLRERLWVLSSPAPMAVSIRKASIRKSLVHPTEVNEALLKETASVLDGRILYRFITDADELVEYFRTEVANRLVKRV